MRETFHPTSASTRVLLTLTETQILPLDPGPRHAREFVRPWEQFQNKKEKSSFRTWHPKNTADFGVSPDKLSPRRGSEPQLGISMYETMVRFHKYIQTGTENGPPSKIV